MVGIHDIHGQGRNLPNHLKDTTLPKFDSLKPAFVIANPRPKIKGDTVEYNTGNIRLHPYANVEDLLGILPGLQIDVDGNIKFNGEKIQHLLVDGEDIFGANPSLVTRNFDASKISKIQVLDRKSEHSLFTGVDDGSRSKTLNLVLKESAKNGYFGKIEGGGGPSNYYNANGACAGFENKEQFAIFGLTNNIGQLSLSSNTNGSPNDVAFRSIGTDPLGASAGKGIPNFAGAAMHYANTWDGTEKHVLANYQFSHNFTRPTSNTEIIQTEADTIYRQSKQGQSANMLNQHDLFATFDWTSSKNAFHSLCHIDKVDGQNQFAASSKGSFNGIPVNSNQREIQDKLSVTNFEDDLYWRSQIGKPRHILSVVSTISNSNNITDGYLYSTSQFHQSIGSLNILDTIDQRKRIVSHPIAIKGKINYTTPLWQAADLGLSYGLAGSIDNSLQATFDRGNGKYKTTVDSLTSHFQSKTVSQQITVNLQGRWNRLLYSLGSSWINVRYRQLDLQTTSALIERYSNWTPQMILNYTLNSTSILRLFYTTSTQQPTASQYQPIKNNNDPLHVSLGNPNLKPSLTKNFRFDFRQGKSWVFFFILNYTSISNNITTKTITDSMGRQISQPTNVNGVRSADLSLSVSKTMAGFNVLAHSEESYSRSLSFINGSLSANTLFTAGMGVNLVKNVPGKYDIQLISNFGHFDQVSSISSSKPIQYWSQNHRAVGSIYFSKKYFINTSVAYAWQQKVNGFAGSTTTILWNESVGRNFLQNRISVKVEIQNLLNRNENIIRTNTDNINTQNTTNMLGRFWLLSTIYHFDKKFNKRSSL